MSQQATIRIPLVEAFFCEDCNSICNSPVQCECGSQALMSMSGVLNRETPGELTEEQLFGEVVSEKRPPIDLGAQGLRLVRR